MVWKRNIVPVLILAVFVLGFASASPRAEDDSGSRWDDLKKRMNQQMDALENQVRPLEEKAARLGRKAEAEWREMVDKLEQSRSQLNEKMAALKKQGGVAWEKGEDELKEALQAIEAALARFRKRLDE